LSPELSLRLVDQLAEFPKPPMLVLTGGDPFKRPDLIDIVEHARSLGLKVSITPSATPLVTPHAIGRFRRAGVSRLAISIDGANPRTHAAMRGVKGSFMRSIRILQAARREGISTQVNTTLTPLNLHHLGDMADLLQDLLIDLWSVFFLVPVGRAAGAKRLASEQYETAFERLWHESQRRPYAIKTTEAPHYRRFAIQHQPRMSQRSSSLCPQPYVPVGINDGKGILFVGHTGAVCPSGFLPIICGTFPHANIVRIYQRAPLFRKLRDADRLEGKCRQCEFRHICGGSRARAYAVTGDPFAEEPDCAYVPASWSRPEPFPAGASN
jgi:radical SAM protein with 4Fe4S-binding SPASM domain